jgi:hypothetical protein
MGLFSKSKDAKASIEKELSANDFKISKTMNFGDIIFGITTIHIDNEHEKWAVISRNKLKIYKFRDIIDYELYQDDKSAAKGRAGSAFVGGLLFGGIGAIAGASMGKKQITSCKSMSILITVNDSENPQIKLPFITSETKTDSLGYKMLINKAKETMAMIEFMQNKSKELSAVQHNSDAVDSLKEYKQLLDDGIITQDEFSAKKKQLLGI